jgi:hypothetical protein
MQEEQLKQAKKTLILALIIIGVVALGLLAVNQALEFTYRSQFLQAPCQLCRELNPDVDHCFNQPIPINQYDGGITWQD